MDHSTDTLADNLKKLREDRNLSLDQLARRTGVSKSMLRQIETGKSSPTIATIWKIANGLKVSFTSLLREPPIEAEVRSFTANPPLTSEKDHYRVFPMVPFGPEHSFESYYIEIDPETVFLGEPHEGNVDEYIYVTSGTMQVRVNDDKFIVQKGEFLKFRANCPHEYACVGATTATALMQISYLP